MSALRRAEHDAWRRVIALLLEMGAVTKEDCEELVSTPPTTPGMRLFFALREWERAALDLYAGEGMRR